MLEDVEARNVNTKKIIWKNTEGETEGRAFTFTSVCEHFKLSPVDEFLWWVYAHHGERRTQNNMSGWWCGAYGQPYDWRQPNRLFIFQISDMANEQVVFTAYWAPD